MSTSTTNVEGIKPSRWLMKKAKQHRSWLLLTIFIGLCQTLATIVLVGSIASIVYSSFILKTPLSGLHLAFILLLAMIFLRSGLSWLKEMAGFKIGANIRASLRQELIKHINYLGPVYSRQFSTGELSTIVVEQVEAVHDFYAYYVPQMALIMLVPIIILCIVFPISWLSGVVLLTCGPLIPFFMALVGMGAAAANERNFQALARMSAHFLDVLQGLTTLKLFNRSREQLKTIERVSDDYRIKTMSVLRIAFMSSGVLEFFSAVSIALVAVLLGLSLLGHIHFGFYGHLTLFGALFILLLAPEFFLPLRDLGAHYHARAQAIGAAEGIMKILATQRPVKTEVISPEKPLVVEQVAIEFKQVAFSYLKKEKQVLQKIDFSVKPGEHVYIVGGSGAGKTTILNLIMGFLQPTAGHIKINESDLQSLDHKQWLKKIAWLGQNPRLFQGSLLENLLIAKPEANSDELSKAMRAANIYDFVQSLPDGLDTQIGEQGTGLSGGQAQRIALARAFLKDAPLLLLDEPTANLDQQSEAQVLSALNVLAHDRTVITLTHRLNQLSPDAKVLVLSEGVFVEQGTCAELLSSAGCFSQMYEIEREEALS